MSYTDEDGKTATYYKDILYTRFQSGYKFKPKAWLIAKGPPFNNTLLYSFSRFWFVSNERMGLPDNIFMNIFHFFASVLGANSWIWEYETSTVMSVDGAREWQDVLGYNINQMINKVLSFMTLMDVKFSLPSDVTISPHDAEYLSYTVEAITAYRFKKWSFQSFTSWQYLDGRIILPFWLKRPILALRYYFDWSFTDPIFEKSVNWLYCYTDPISGENLYYRGDDEFWDTHGFPGGRKYRLFEDFVCRDFAVLVVLWLILSALKHLNFLGSMKDIALIVWRFTQGKLKDYIEEIKDLLEDKVIEEEDRLGFIKAIEEMLALVQNQWKAW